MLFGIVHFWPQDLRPSGRRRCLTVFDFFYDQLVFIWSSQCQRRLLHYLIINASAACVDEIHHISKAGTRAHIWIQSSVLTVTIGISIVTSHEKSLITVWKKTTKKHAQNICKSTRMRYVAPWWAKSKTADTQREIIPGNSFIYQSHPAPPLPPSLFPLPFQSKFQCATIRLLTLSKAV